jgi:adenine phosphoribosyltransferase
VDNLKRMIREIPDFPKPGILFYDITTLLKHPYGFRTTIDRLTEMVGEERIDTVVGMEARGFIFAPALAYRLGAGFVPIRKPKKLPGETERIEYSLEYGTDALEVHKDAIGKGCRVLVADDLLATGGTAKAVVDLIERLGGEVVATAFVVELTFLNGRERIAPHKVASLLKYDK